MLLKWNKGEKKGIKINPYFSYDEFECKCSNPSCVEQMIDTDLTDKLLEVRKSTGISSIIVTSGFRCLEHNTKIGGKAKSSHMTGLAADIISHHIDKKEFDKICERVFDNTGIDNKFVHCDVRSGGPRRWTY